MWWVGGSLAPFGRPHFLRVRKLKVEATLPGSRLSHRGQHRLCQSRVAKHHCLNGEAPLVQAKHLVAALDSPKGSRGLKQPLPIRRLPPNRCELALQPTNHPCPGHPFTPPLKPPPRITILTALRHPLRNHLALGVLHQVLFLQAAAGLDLVALQNLSANHRCSWAAKHRPNPRCRRSSGSGMAIILLLLRLKKGPDRRSTGIAIRRVRHWHEPWRITRDFLHLCVNIHRRSTGRHEVKERHDLGGRRRGTYKSRKQRAETARMHNDAWVGALMNEWVR